MTKPISPYDAPRKLIVPGGKEETIDYCVKDIIEQAQQAISQRGRFVIALSGGSTPKVIYDCLAKNHQDSCDWKKVWVFWSDERSVPPTDPDSNYHMAMEYGIAKLPIPEEQIFRMPAEAENLDQAAQQYEKTLLTHVPDGKLDFIMLGMGDDGHTASLFPHTEGLKEQARLVIANHVPQKQTSRMTFTFLCLNQARAVRFYVLGESKAPMLASIFTKTYQPELLPSQAVGTHKNPSHWIADKKAASQL